MGDSKAYSIGGFIEGLTILSKYIEGGRDAPFKLGAEHDSILVYAGDAVTPKDRDALAELGFSQNGGFGWEYFT